MNAQRAACGLQILQQRVVLYPQAPLGLAGGFAGLKGPGGGCLNLGPSGKTGVQQLSLQAELLDPSFAARAEIEAATARALQSREAARETERGLGIQYDSLLQNLQAAGRSLGIQQAALATATEALSAERRRLEAGLISTVAFLQAELASIQAELAAQQAQSSYWRAYYSLLTGGR